MKEAGEGVGDQYSNDSVVGEDCMAGRFGTVGFPEHDVWFKV